MRWQQIARLAIAAFVIVFAGAVVFIMRQRSTLPPPSTAGVPTDENTVVASSGAIEYNAYDQGRLRFSLKGTDHKVLRDGRTEISVHLKLPGALSLGEAHAVAEQVERTILDAVPEATAVRTHLEPLAETSEGRRPREREVEDHIEAVLRIVTDELGAPPRAMRMLETGDGLVLFLTLALDPHTELAAAHEKASAVEERIRRERPDVADVHVHTEP